MEQQKPQPKAPRPKLNLPFRRRRFDAGEWAYDHRVAILVTVVAYVIFGVAFVTADIIVSRRDAQSEILLDLTDLAELQEELRRAQELNKLLNERYDDSPASNRISNDDALDEELEDHRTDASKIYSEADEVQQRLRQNADAYAEGLNAEREILNRRYEGEKEGESKRVRGKVTVSYSLGNPLRHALSMPVPSYMCEGGGEVVVNITVDRDGYVISAKVDDRRSEKNACLREAALQKAEESVFNANVDAPAKQHGTIEYLFISQ
ncbi:MAG: energy transducer TonB [Tidjanibacter sp.]|nr:energy transducer TonB [Tidjanibacter sp.]